jgi:integrase
MRSGWSKKEIEVFVDEEVKAIMKASRGDRFEALYKLAIGTGARQGELMCLEMDDVDIGPGEVRITKTIDGTRGVTTIIPPKSRAGTRTVSLPAFALAAVKKHLKGRKAGPVFVTSEETLLQRSNFIRQEWAKLLYARRLPIESFTPFGIPTHHAYSRLGWILPKSPADR